MASELGQDADLLFEAERRRGEDMSKRHRVSHGLSQTVEGTPRRFDVGLIKKLEERLPREKLLSDYVLLIPKSKLEDTLKKRPELLEKKDQGKK